MDNITDSFKNKNLKTIIKGSVISILSTFIMLFIFAIVLTYTSVSENIIVPGIIVISSISILLGSSIGTIRLRKNGLLNGAVIGLIYIVMLYIFSSITCTGFSINISSLIMIICSILAGMTGGIIGINIG